MKKKINDYSPDFLESMIAGTFPEITGFDTSKGSSFFELQIALDVPAEDFLKRLDTYLSTLIADFEDQQQKYQFTITRNGDTVGTLVYN